MLFEFCRRSKNRFRKFLVFLETFRQSEISEIAFAGLVMRPKRSPGDAGDVPAHYAFNRQRRALLGYDDIWVRRAQHMVLDYVLCLFKPKQADFIQHFPLKRYGSDIS